MDCRTVRIDESTTSYGEDETIYAEKNNSRRKSGFVLMGDVIAIQIDENKFIVPKVTANGKFISVVKEAKKEKYT